MKLILYPNALIFEGVFCCKNHQKIGFEFVQYLKILKIYDYMLEILFF